MKAGWSLLLVCMLLACKDRKEEPAGGPCSYNERILPAKLISLNTSDSQAYNASFEIEWTAGNKDTVLYSLLNNSHISAEQVQKDSIREGSIYKFVEQQLVSGSCNPHITLIRLEKY